MYLAKQIKQLSIVYERHKISLKMLIGKGLRKLFVIIYVVAHQNGQDKYCFDNIYKNLRRC